MIIIDNNTIILLGLIWVGAQVLNRTRILRDFDIFCCVETRSAQYKMFLPLGDL